MAKEEKGFVGKFKEPLERFIRHKRDLGYKYNTNRYHLRRFSEYTLDQGIESDSLSKQLVLKWTAKRKNESARTWEHRASYLRQFALYLQSQGFRAFIPPKNRKATRAEYITYIFSRLEIDRSVQT